MTTFTCPEGHQSADPEWCDTCGSPIGRSAGGAAPAGPGGPSGLAGGAGPVTTPTATVAPGGTPPRVPTSSGPTVTCTHCGTVNEVDALFCESCGFDFTTGQAPPPPRPPVAVAPVPDVSTEPTDFAVEVAVDPAWYALQGADSNEPCPAPSRVSLSVRGTTLLIGRTSAEKAVDPEIALNDDPGVSRRHAQLVQGPDGTWSAVDQGSMNGTYVVVGGVVPTDPPAPIAVGEPVALAAGDVVFVGAWSRITLIDRRAQQAAAPGSPPPSISLPSPPSPEPT